jgi:hypothetical protein
MTKMAGSGSISQRHESADPDPYPHQMSWIRNTAAEKEKEKSFFLAYFFDALFTKVNCIFLLILGTNIRPDLAKTTQLLKKKSICEF